MKVIKEGKEGGLWSPQVECSGAGNGNAGCGAILEVSASDLFHTKNCDYTGDCDHYLTFECPLCKEWTDINQTKTAVPHGIKSKILALEPRFQSRENRVTENNL